MYRCKDCGHLFEDGEQKRGRSLMGEHFGAPYYEDYDGCPKCGGDYEEVHFCKICDEYTTDEYCPDCIKKVSDLFREFVEKNLTEDEYELLVNMITEDEL